mgnify:CR=1 FL=1
MSFLCFKQGFRPLTEVSNVMDLSEIRTIKNLSVLQRLHLQDIISV